MFEKKPITPIMADIRRDPRRLRRFLRRNNGYSVSRGNRSMMSYAAVHTFYRISRGDFH